MNPILRPLLLGLGWMLAGTGAAHGAETLGVVPDSAEALGTAGGRYANLRDASTTRANPANLTYLTAPTFLVNAAVWHGRVGLDSAAGDPLRLEDSTKFLGSLYYAHPLRTNRLALGLGVSTPYGLDSKYAPGGTLRYLVPYEARLLTLALTPAVAYRPVKGLSIGAGAEILYSQLQLRQFYPWSAAMGGAPVPDGEIRFDGEGVGLGGYLGATWEWGRRHRLSVVGRLPLRVEYTGDFNARGMPAALRQAGFREQSDFQSDITFPGSVGAGYGVDLPGGWTLGLDVQWVGNSSHDDVPLRIGPNQPLLNGTAVPLRWKDSWDAGIGASWRWREDWVLRAGYLYSGNSQPSSTYTPAVPSNERHLFAGGLGWRGRRHGLDLTYAYAHFPERVIEGAAQPAFNGRYFNGWHIVSLSYTHRF